MTDLCELHEKWARGELTSEFSVVNGILTYNGRYYMSAESELRKEIIREHHCSPAAGHGGVKKTLVSISALFYWPKMRHEVELFVRDCIVCQQVKSLTTAPAGLLQPLPVPALVWNDLTMDFITHLPLSRGYSVVMVVVDRLTKAAHFGALLSGFTAAKAAKLFVEMVVKLHGFPASIVSDRDPIFLSKFWEELFKLSGSTLKYSTAYHPQTDGQTEVVNRGLEQYLRAMTGSRPQQWFDLLSWAEFCYNTSYHSSIRMSPFQALYGRPPPVIPRYVPGSTTLEALDEMLLERDNLLSELKESLRVAQQRMEQKANKKRREFEFQVGDKVWVKLQPYRQKSVAKRNSNKLEKRYFGPYTVVGRVGKVSYKLALPADSRIHPVFHISLLKPYQGSDIPPVNPIPGEEVHPVIEPLVICSARRVLRHGQVEPQILVQWKGQPPEAATWESTKEFQQMFPDFHLEDKVLFEDEGVDTAVENMGESVVEEEKVAGRPQRARKKPSKFADYV